MVRVFILLKLNNIGVFVVEIQLNKKITNKKMAEFMKVSEKTVANNKKKYVDEFCHYFKCDVVERANSKGIIRYDVYPLERILPFDYVKQGDYKKEITYKAADERIVEGKYFTIKEISDNIYATTWCGDEKLIDKKPEQCYNYTFQYKKENYGTGKHGQGKKGFSDREWCKVLHNGEVVGFSEEEKKIFNKLCKTFFDKVIKANDTQELISSIYDAQKAEDNNVVDYKKQVGEAMFNILANSEWENVLEEAAKLFNCEAIIRKFTVKQANIWE